MPGSCSICAHTARRSIDRLLLSGASIREVAGQFGVGKSAVERHKAAHVTPTTAPVVAARAAVVEAAEVEVRAALVDTTRSTLEQVRDLGMVARQCLERVTDPGVEFVARDVAAIMQQVRGALELQAKLLGELGAGATVQIAIVQSPEWGALRAVLLDALARHPDALADVAEALEKHEGTGAAVRSG